MMLYSIIVLGPVRSVEVDPCKGQSDWSLPADGCLTAGESGPVCSGDADLCKDLYDTCWLVETEGVG